MIKNSLSNPWLKIIYPEYIPERKWNIWERNPWRKPCEIQRWFLKNLWSNPWKTLCRNSWRQKEQINAFRNSWRSSRRTRDDFLGNLFRKSLAKFVILSSNVHLEKLSMELLDEFQEDVLWKFTEKNLGEILGQMYWHAKIFSNFFVRNNIQFSSSIFH